jgi:hypothetical protein
MNNEEQLKDNKTNIEMTLMRYKYQQMRARQSWRSMALTKSFKWWVLARGKYLGGRP